LNSNSVANPTATPAATTQYILQVTDGLGAIDRDTVIVTVYQLPTVELGPPVLLCSGDSAVLDAGSGMTVYSWSTGASSQTITVSIADTYYVTVINSYGCVNSDSVVVTVGSQPIATITGDTNICDNETAMLVAGGGGTYLWSTMVATDTIYVSPSVTTQYYVVVSVGSCVDTAYFTLTVYPSPNVDLGPDQGLCVGDSVILDAGGGFLSYIWSTTEISQTIDVYTSGIYSVTVADAGFCPGIDSVVVVFDTIPNAYILGDTAMCFGDSIVLTGYGGGAYLWSNSSPQNSITVSPISNTTYTLTVSNGACTSTATYNITVYPLPTVFAGYDTTVAAGTSVQLHATGGTTYTWSPTWYLSCYDCPDPICTPDATTAYLVTITDDHGCTNTDDVIVYVEYECGDIFVPTAFAPNGNNYNDYFRILGGCFTTFNLQIFDRWGNKIYESDEQSLGWDGTYKAEPMDGGIYYFIYSGTRIDGETVAGNGDVTLIR
jgi:gliding motility-associated-like protein